MQKCYVEPIVGSERSSGSQLGLLQAIGLAISFVVGSGILVLPVLVLDLVGPVQSVWVWIVMTVVGLPLLFIFNRLAGDSDFSLSQTFKLLLGPSSERASKWNVMLALLFGMPAMISTTATMFYSGVSMLGPVGLLGVQKSVFVSVTSHFILFLLCLNHLRPVHRSTRISLFTSGFLILLMFACVGLRSKQFESGLEMVIRTTPELNINFLKACAVSFFAYVGWESVGFFSKDLKDPAKNLKWVLGGSFIIVSLAYLGLAVVLSGTSAAHEVISSEQGFLSLLKNDSLRLLLLALTVLLIVANLNAWVLGGKVQMEELLNVGVGDKRALFFYFMAVSVLLFPIDMGVVGIEQFFLMSNQGWILIYAGIIGYYFKMASGFKQNLVGVLGAISFLFLFSGCNAWIILQASLFLIEPVYARIKMERYRRRFG